jgi:hypothetical protein
VPIRSLVLLVTLTSTSAHSAAIWEMRYQADPASDMPGPGFRYVTDGKRLRLEQFLGDGRISSISYVIDGTTLTTWPQKDHLSRCDPACMAYFEASPREAYERKLADLERVPEGHREMTRKSILAPTPEFAAIKTNQRLDIAGYQCTLWEVRFGGKLLKDYCTVEFSAVPGGAQLGQMMRGEQERWRARDAAHLKYSRLAPVLVDFRPPFEIAGLPVRVRDFEHRSVPSVYVLKAVRTEELPEGQFHVPTNLTVKDLGRRTSTSPPAAPAREQMEAEQHLWKMADMIKAASARQEAGLSELPDPCTPPSRCIIDLSDNSAAVHVVAVRGDLHHATLDPVEGKARVNADAPGKPIVIVLAAEGPMRWTVTASPQTRIQKIVAFGGGRQTVSAPTGVGVITRSPLDRRDYALAVGFQTSERQRFVSAVQNQFGTTLASLQCSDYRPSFTISTNASSDMSAEEYRRPCTVTPHVDAE